jgi:hypothetical protein
VREDVKQAKEDLFNLMEKMKALADNPEICKYDIKDGQYIESSGIVLHSFLARAEITHKKLIRLLEVMPRRRRVKT